MKLVRSSKQEEESNVKENSSKEIDNTNNLTEIQVLQTKPYWTTTHKPFHPKLKIYLIQGGKKHFLITLIDTRAGILTISLAIV